MPGKFKIELRDLSRDSLNQINKQFDAIEKAISVAATTKPTLAPVAATPIPTDSPTGILVETGLVGVSSGTPTTNPTSIRTDGTTISGDGDSTPIALITPVALANGGTGLPQTGTQQITTNGTLIAAGTAQAQLVANIAGVTAQSAAMWSLPNAPDATWQTGIAGFLVCGAGTVTLYLVNPTAASITPIAQLVNIKAIL